MTPISGTNMVMGKRGGECLLPGQEGKPAGYSMQMQLSPEAMGDWMKPDSRTFCPVNLSRRPTDPATESAAHLCADR